MENKLCFLFSLRGAPSLTRARSGGRGKEGSGGGGGEARGLVGGDSRALQTRCCLFAHRASGRVFADFSFFFSWFDAHGLAAGEGALAVLRRQEASAGGVGAAGGERSNGSNGSGLEMQALSLFP